MEKKTQQHLPVLVGGILGLGVTLMVAILLSTSQQTAHFSRQRRDIKPIQGEPSQPNDISHQATQLSSPTQQDTKQGQEMNLVDTRTGFSSFSFADNAGLEGRASSLRAFVLVREEDGSIGAEMTWASGIKDVTYHPIEEGAQHSSYLNSLAILKSGCDNKLKHQWYLFTSHLVYVHVDLLHTTLQMLSYKDAFVLGTPDEASDRQCSASIFLLSQTAMHNICQQLDQLEGEFSESSKTILDVVLEIVDIQCMDVTKISHSKSISTLTPKLLHSNEFDISKVMFVGPLTSVHDLHKLHLFFTERKIASLQKFMYHLNDQMTPDSLKKVRPKRDSEESTMETSVLVSHGSMLNSTHEPFYEYFNKHGTVYPESCRIEKDTLNQNEAFITSKALAYEHLKDRMGKDVNNMDEFGYKIVKANSGVEYQFYLVDDHKLGPHNRHSRVYQAIVEQSFANLQIDNKVFQKPEDVTIVTMADDLTQLPNLLSSLVRSCHVIRKVKAKCTILVLYEDMVSQERELQDIISNLTSIEVRIFSRDISSASHLMNNFQRALVKVHETLYDDSLVIFLHPKTRISEQFLWRCQINTILGSSAYFPIPFQHTTKTEKRRDRNSNLSISSKTGFWKSTDFDTFCAHAKDLQRLTILPKSPKMLYQLISNVLQLKRIPDSAVWRKWEEELCPEVDSRDSCIQDLMYRNM